MHEHAIDALVDAVLVVEAVELAEEGELVEAFAIGEHEHRERCLHATLAPFARLDAVRRLEQTEARREDPANPTAAVGRRPRRSNHPRELARCVVDRDRDAPEAERDS
jgi:hypothetical protein